MGADTKFKLAQSCGSTRRRHYASAVPPSLMTTFSDINFAILNLHPASATRDAASTTRCSFKQPPVVLSQRLADLVSGLIGLRLPPSSLCRHLWLSRPRRACSEPSLASQVPCRSLEPTALVCRVAPVQQPFRAYTRLSLQQQRRPDSALLFRHTCLRSRSIRDANTMVGGRWMRLTR